jgi:hypothetical protein
MQRTGMGCLGSLATFLYLPISVGLFFGPAILLTYFGLPEWVGQGVGLAIGGLFCLLLTFIPPALVMKRVEQMGYET